MVINSIMKPNIICLAPMEGVVDALMRQLLTTFNPFDYCITEFIRVTERLVPKHTFYKIAPELKTQGKTISGTPVIVQLLGQHPQWMAENAIIASELGAPGIDLNFGCPAKTVNKSKGGAVLLKEPERIYQIVSAVREAITDSTTPVSAKVRLGFDDTSLFNEIVDAVQQAGANAITIHARTKKQGYKPPAHWHYIGELSSKVTIPIIANGEIWDKHDAIQCMTKAKTSGLMLGRGALATPNLAQVLSEGKPAMSWQQVCQLLVQYADIACDKQKPYYFSSRIKQWLRYLKLQYPEAQQLFEQIKTIHDQTLLSFIKSYC